MRHFFSFLFLLLALAVNGQQDPTLKTRVTEFMKANEAMDLEKVMDYTYPKLFTIVPREQLVEVMKQAFSNEQMTIKLDSLRADSIYPAFQLEGGSFAKINYSMKMLMKMKPADDSTKTGEMVEMVASGLAGQFGEENVRIDAPNNTVIVRMSTPMVGVKDNLSKEWTFVNLKPEDPLTSQLFSKAVLDKLATYK